MAAPPPPPVAPGDVLAGKYCVERVLGFGGMGVVVAALHMQLGQHVALKFLLPDGMANPQVVQRFEREARAAAQLRSEHVARVIDVGRMEAGTPYIVMELLNGQDMGDLLIDSGPLSEVDACDYVLQACEAIAEAHTIGIVHRDLKPKNLFVTRRVDGAPLIKVLDFGISKVSGAADLNLTGTAEIIGSPNYMSPEQLRASRDVDLRSDIWSIGAILYELLGGRVPFVAETLTQLCSMVLTEPPRPLEELRPEVHPELRRVIAKCLEKDPANRFRNIGELAMALAPFASAAGSTLASRVAVVAGSGRYLPESASSPRVSVPGPGGGSTSVSWDATELAHTRQQPRKALFAGALVGATVVSAIAAGLFLFSGSSKPTATGSNPPSAPVSVAAPAPSPTTSSSGSTNLATAIATAPTTTTPSPTPSATPSASSATTPIASSRLTKPPVLKPTLPIKRPSDDLPIDRK